MPLLKLRQSCSANDESLSLLLAIKFHREKLQKPVLAKVLEKCEDNWLRSIRFWDPLLCAIEGFFFFCTDLTLRCYCLWRTLVKKYKYSFVKLWNLSVEHNSLKKKLHRKKIQMMCIVPKCQNIVSREVL